MRASLYLAGVATSMLALCSAALAEKRLALVVGNGAYQSLSALPNPPNDAADIGAMLKKLDFEVIEGTDLDREALRGKVEAFSARLGDLAGEQEEIIALFYYSGHGMQVAGRNYLIPVNARIDKVESVEFQNIEMDQVLRVMEQNQGVNIVILDACRNDPFDGKLKKRTKAAESAYESLGEIKKSKHAIVLFATDPGNTADDGSGRNSPYTKAFLAIAPTPGMEIIKVAKEVGSAVTHETGSKQVPWFNSSYNGDVYLGGAPKGALQLASLQQGDAPPSPPSAQRIAAIPAAPGVIAPKAAPAPVDIGEACDRAAGDLDDPLRNKSVPFVRYIDAPPAIAACEKAVAALPKVTRYTNQLARSLQEAGRYEEALRIYKEAAGRDSPSAYATAQIGYLYYRGWGGAPKDYAQARKWFVKAADLGVAGAMGNLGYMYLHGISVPKDPVAGIAWYNKAVALDHLESLNDLAYLHLEGTGVPKDYARAKELFTKTSNLDDAEGMYGLGYLAATGKGEPKSFDVARRWLEKSAAAQNPHAMFDLGGNFQFGNLGVAVNYKLARQWYERAVKLKNSGGMIRLASLYADGLGVERDTDKARELLEQAASYDDTDAMVRLAKGYRDGIFGEVDRAQARVWLEKAVLLDSDEARDLLADERPGEAPGDACDRLASLEKDPLHAPSIANFGYVNPKRAIPVCEAAVKALPKVLRYQNQLGQAYLEAERYGDAFKIFNAAAAKGSVFATGWMGTLYDRGWGVGKDVKLANDWHRKAVATGSASAMYNLGQSLLNGTGIAKDVPAARKLFDQAAAKGSTAAMMQLGTLFDNGEGVAKDATLAREWYQKAVDGGETSAEFSLALLYLDGTGVEKNETEARRRFGIAAAGGSTASMRKLANLYLHGIGGEVELQKARGLLEQAANKDDTRAMNLLAQALLAGVFKDVDLEEGRPGGADEALSWYRKSAAAGNEAAISWMANFAPGAKGNAAMGDDCDRAAGAAEDDRHSVNIPTTTQVDAKLGVPACEAAVAAAPGNLRYANQLARVYLTAGRDYDAVRVFKDAARRGSNFAMLWVGNAYDRKLAGLERNPGETALWYEKAAANGSRTAMFNLGVLNINLYNDDIEPQKNAVAAAQWFGKAAELGNPDALRQMAVMYREGIGVAQDKARYHDLLAKAANLGDAGALRDMARNAASGDGMAKNMTLAVEYATKAADAGDIDVLTDLAALLYRAGGPDNLARSRATLEKGVARQDIRAIVNLAVLLRDGRFGKAEPAEARRLQKLAADLDPKKAKAELDRLEN